MHKESSTASCNYLLHGTCVHFLFPASRQRRRFGFVVRKCNVPYMSIKSALHNVCSICRCIILACDDSYDDRSCHKFVFSAVCVIWHMDTLSLNCYDPLSTENLIQFVFRLVTSFEFMRFFPLLIIIRREQQRSLTTWNATPW